MSPITSRVARGAGWVYAYRWGERALDLVSIVVLARLLVPEDFGLVAIAASIVAMIEGMSDFDVDKALIHNRDEGSDLYDTAWTLSTLRGLLTAAIMLIVSLFVGDVRLVAILWALAVSPILKGLSNPRFVLFERQLVYSKLAWLSLATRLATFAVTIGTAWVYHSYWALVLGAITGASVRLVMTYALRPHRPRWSLARAKDIFAFSGWMSLTTLVTTLAMETDKIIVGRLISVADAGLYFMTQRSGALPTREIISPLQRILFPSFSEIAGDRRRLRRVVTESINVLGSLSLPAGCGFALVAAEIVPLALGVKWTPIVPLLTVLVPFLGFRGTLSTALPCVMALNETRMLFQVSVIYALVHIPAFVAGTHYYGLMGAIGSIVLAGFFYTYLNAWMLHRTLGITVLDILGALRRPLVATALMVLAVWSLPLPSHPAETLAQVLNLLAKVTTGVVVFALAQLGQWQMEGRPSGIEQRFLQVLRQRRAAR